MVTPHTSCRYAVIHAHALNPAFTGYVVCAVHAMTDELPGQALVSRVVTSTRGTLLAFHHPEWVSWLAVAALCANSKTAHAIRAELLDQDRRAGQ